MQVQIHRTQEAEHVHRPGVNLESEKGATTHKMKFASAPCHELPPNEEKIIVLSVLYLYRLDTIVVVGTPIFW